jgi:hypothetical protein
MGEIVGRVNLPFIASSMMRSMFDSISDSIPHVWVSARQVHLHPQCSGFLGVFAIPHLLEFGQTLFNRSISMFTWDWVSFSSSSVFLDLLGCLSAPVVMMGLTIAGTDVSMTTLGELDGEGMELVKVVARVGDFPWFVA